MSQGKQIKKCRQSFSVYIPPPARKAENLSKEVIQKEELKSKKVVKVRSGDIEKVNKNTSPDAEIIGSPSCHSPTLKECVKKNDKDCLKSDCPKELSVTLNFSKLRIACTDKQKSKKKSYENQSGNSPLNTVEAPEESNCTCTFSNVLTINENAKDICVKQTTVKADLHKSTCNTPLKTDENVPLSSNDKISPEDENGIFKNLWVKLCEHENLEFKTNKTHTHKGNEIYGTKEINEKCIIEIYDFPAEFKTSDLREIFSSYITRGMKIRWVDDTHALGIYPSEIIAYEVLNTDLPNLKTRILDEGIQESRDKAKLLLPPPPPPRPKTCSASARRLVSGALGIKAVFTQAEIEEERQLLQVAREQKLLAAKQRGLKGS